MLIIFDCDGVLVDSERLAADVFSKQLQAVHIPMTPEQCYAAFKGQSLAACFTWLEASINMPLPATFPADLSDATRRAFASQLQAVAGVELVLQSLQKANIPVCVASNGEREKIHNSLLTTGLNRYFPETHRFSARDVAAGKPAPDLFFLAAESMGVPTQFCWVIEDSLPGLKAAASAGMQSFYFDPHNENVAEHAGLEVVRVKSMPQLLQCLATSAAGGICDTL